MIFFRPILPESIPKETEILKSPNKKPKKTFKKTFKKVEDKSKRELGYSKESELDGGSFKETKDTSVEEYKDLINPQELVLDDSHRVAVRVKRSEESNDDLGLLYLDVQHWVDTDVFTGYTKQKIHIPLYKLAELKMLIEDVLTECDENGLLKESSDEWKD